MVATTTPISACDVSLWLDDLSGSLTDISGSSNQLDMNFTQNIGEVMVFQSRWPTRQECGKDAAITIQVIYSTAADEGFDLLKKWYFATSPGARTFNAFIPDKNVGSDKYSGEVRLAGFNFTASREEAGPVIVSMELLPDGEFCHTTAST